MFNFKNKFIFSFLLTFFLAFTVGCDMDDTSTSDLPFDDSGYGNVPINDDGSIDIKFHGTWKAASATDMSLDLNDDGADDLYIETSTEYIKIGDNVTTYYQFDDVQYINGFDGTIGSILYSVYQLSNMWQGEEFTFTYNENEITISGNTFEFDGDTLKLNGKVIYTRVDDIDFENTIVVNFDIKLSEYQNPTGTTILCGVWKKASQDNLGVDLNDDDTCELKVGSTTEYIHFFNQKGTYYQKLNNISFINGFDGVHKDTQYSAENFSGIWAQKADDYVLVNNTVKISNNTYTYENENLVLNGKIIYTKVSNDEISSKNDYPFFPIDLKIVETQSSIDSLLGTWKKVTPSIELECSIFDEDEYFFFKDNYELLLLDHIEYIDFSVQGVNNVCDYYLDFLSVEILPDYEDSILDFLYFFEFSLEDTWYYKNENFSFDNNQVTVNGQTYTLENNQLLLNGNVIYEKETTVTFDDDDPAYYQEYFYIEDLIEPSSY